jgi:hypothetical protein
LSQADREVKSKQQQEINDFPMFFAFSEAQFNEGMKELGLRPSDTDKVCRLGWTGGFFLRTDGPRSVSD